MDTTATPVATLGLVADTQYADADDALSYDQTEARHYRDALPASHLLAATWAAATPPPDLIVHLGDVIDGRHPGPAPEDAIRDIVAALSTPVVAPLVGVAGNHEFYAMAKAHPPADVRPLLATHLGWGSDPALRGSRVVGAGILRVICVDSYEVSEMGAAGDAEKAAADALLAANNPNAVKNSPDGLDGYDQRWVAFGGGTTPDQVAWLAAELADAAAAGQTAVVCSHVPLHPRGASRPTNVVWNYDELEPVLCAAAAAGVLLACFAGHDHSGMIAHAATVGTNVYPHFVTLPAILTSAPGTTAGLRLVVYDDASVVLVDDSTVADGRFDLVLRAPSDAC